MLTLNVISHIKSTHSQDLSIKKNKKTNYLVFSLFMLVRFHIEASCAVGGSHWIEVLQVHSLTNDHSRALFQNFYINIFNAC